MSDDFEIIRKINLESKKKSEASNFAPNLKELDTNEKPQSLPGKKNKSKKLLKFFLGAFFILVLVLIICVLFIVRPLLKVYEDVEKLAKNANEVQAIMDSPDIQKIKQQAKIIRENLASLENSVNYFSWTKNLPILGRYYSDFQSAIRAGFYGLDAADIAISTVEPYADIIGLTPNKDGAKSGEETANDRIEFVIQTLEEVIPKIEEISSKVVKVQEEIDKIDPSFYPEKIRDFKVREKIIKIVSLVDEGAKILSDAKPLLQKAPYLIGLDAPRTYLVLFQNDKELRPTGGFITAYSIMTVDKGRMRPVSSNDIYNLDSRYTPVVPAPEVLRKYLKGPYILSKNYRLRDMNFAADFKESMALFTKEAEKVGIRDIDGVIAVDTEVVVRILEVVGKIGVPGFGNFSTEIIPECDCPQVVYELESFADIEGPVVWSQDEPDKIIYAPPNYDNRKKIVGPLMNSVIANALGQPKEKVPSLTRVAWDLLTQKHVLLYLKDEEAQKAAEAFNIAGRISDFDGDYLHINDANLGGRKSNLYVTQEVHQEILVSQDGSIEKTLEITYKNPKSYDGWLNSVLPNWTRIYVPRGSQLISVTGFDQQGEAYEEYGKTVFSGGFQLRPEGVVKITIRYKLPFKANKNYNLLIQKQPGTASPLYTLKAGKFEDEFFLWTDRKIKLSL